MSYVTSLFKMLLTTLGKIKKADTFFNQCETSTKLTLATTIPPSSVIHEFIWVYMIT